MRYSEYRCSKCGHRLFSHVDGGTFCPDCGYYFPADDDGGAAKGRPTPLAHS